PGGAEFEPVPLLPLLRRAVMRRDLDGHLVAQRLAPDAAELDLVGPGERLRDRVRLAEPVLLLRHQPVAAPPPAADRLPVLVRADRADRFGDGEVDVGLVVPGRLDGQVMPARAGARGDAGSVVAAAGPVRL